MSDETMGGMMYEGCEIVNLTGRSVALRPASGPDVVVLPSPAGARVERRWALVGRVGGLPVPVVGLLGELVSGLPAAEPGRSRVYLVTGEVLRAAGSRSDLLAPDETPEGGAVLDGHGRVVAVTRLVTGLSQRGGVGRVLAADEEPLL